jgi:hypothetical protein
MIHSHFALLQVKHTHHPLQLTKDLCKCNQTVNAPTLPDSYGPDPTATVQSELRTAAKSKEHASATKNRLMVIEVSPKQLTCNTQNFPIALALPLTTSKKRWDSGKKLTGSTPIPNTRLL